MKKNGFTLAEVLITLAIIGVVATMTLPALMTNTQEQQAKTGLKKAINTLTEAASMNLAIDSFDYGDILKYGDVDAPTVDEEGNPTTTNHQTLFEILSNRTAIDYTKTNNQANHINNGISFTEKGQTVFFRDGSALIIPENAEISASATTNGDDGIVRGFVVVVDTNGAKAPNVLSNCVGAAKGAFDNGINESAYSTGAGAGNVKDEEGATVSDCNVKAKRVIKDQFTVFLRGSVVEPAGAAAIWALNN